MTATASAVTATAVTRSAATQAAAAATATPSVALQLGEHLGGPVWHLRAHPGEGPGVTVTLSLDGPGRVAGAGVDLIDVPRIELALERSGSALERRICTPAELAVVPLDASRPGRAEVIATAFSLKESALKALGGIAPGARFTDIDTHDCLRAGSPAAQALHLTGATADRADAAGLALIGGIGTVTAGLFLTWVVAVPIERSRP